MDFGSKQISIEKVEVPFHKHSLIPFTRFAFGNCKVCTFPDETSSYFYGGYRCNELGCEEYVFHKGCVKPLPEINHSSHPDHPLKLILLDLEKFTCSICGKKFKVGYCCLICDFNLDLRCARIPHPFVLPENSYGHEHPLFCEVNLDLSSPVKRICKACHVYIFWSFLPFKFRSFPHYKCHQCEFVIHVDCLDFFQKAYHTAHPQHQLKSLKAEVPDYADKKCLLCERDFNHKLHLHHCDVCNFSICRACMQNPPPVDVESPTTHEHQLHLVPRRIDFTCNACGTLGNRSPYFCLQCNFMIHRQCIDLPRVININRHDHRISYTPRLGHGEWKCRVCRKKVDGFYGAYTCVRCPTFSVHSLCATRADVWDMVELEGIPEEEEIPPFVVIDDSTIKHFSHDHHNLRINKDCDGRILPENIVCEACVLQILSEPFYSCKQCNFILHAKCANLPRKKRHVRSNQPFTLRTDSLNKVDRCKLCYQLFTGFRYEISYATIDVTIDVRCAAISDTLEHGSHQHPLYYIKDEAKHLGDCFYKCDECDYILNGKYAHFPKKVMKKRYDDHPLLLCFGDMDVDGEYWCEACETKVNPKEWFYACKDCMTTLHISCVVGDFSYIMPGSVDESLSLFMPRSMNEISNVEVVSNTSICRPLCSVCNSRCNLPSIVKLSKAGVDVYFCSVTCHRRRDF